MSEIESTKAPVEELMENGKAKRCNCRSDWPHTHLKHYEMTCPLYNTSERIAGTPQLLTKAYTLPPSEEEDQPKFIGWEDGGLHRPIGTTPLGEEEPTHHEWPVGDQVAKLQSRVAVLEDLLRASLAFIDGPLELRLALIPKIRAALAPAPLTEGE